MTWLKMFGNQTFDSKVLNLQRGHTLGRFGLQCTTNLQRHTNAQDSEILEFS